MCLIYRGEKVKIRLILFGLGMLLLAGGWVSAHAGLPTTESAMWSPPSQRATPPPHGLPEIYLEASNRQSYDSFGYAVDVDGTILVVGAPGKNEAGPEAGGLYVFERNGADWTETARLLPDVRDQDRLGMAVAVSGETLVGGAPYATTQTGGFAAGAVYVYVRQGGNWQAQTRLTAPDGNSFDLFGGAVDLAGDTLVVGAQGADSPSGARNAGAAYVFHRENGVWVEQARLSSPEGGADDFLGQSVAIQGNVIAVGAFGHDEPDTGPNAGAVYLFEGHDVRWYFQAKLTSADPVPKAQFGFSLAFAGDGQTSNWLAVGANQYSPAPVDPRYGAPPGRVELFHWKNEAWQSVTQFVPEQADEQETGYFGASVAISWVGGDRPLVATGSAIGGRNLYLFPGPEGEPARVVQPAGFQWGFGRSLAIHGETLAVGSPWMGVNESGFPAGGVYLYDLSGLK